MKNTDVPQSEMRLVGAKMCGDTLAVLFHTMEDWNHWIESGWQQAMFKTMLSEGKELPRLIEVWTGSVDDIQLSMKMEMEYPKGEAV